MNQQAMLNKLKKMQDDMLKTQEEINSTIFIGKAGGVVTIEMFGTKHLASVEIDKEFLPIEEDGVEMLSDMIQAACEDCYQQIEKMTDEKMGPFNSFLGGMGGLF